MWKENKRLIVLGVLTLGLIIYNEPSSLGKWEEGKWLFPGLNCVYIEKRAANENTKKFPFCPIIKTSELSIEGNVRVYFPTAHDWVVTPKKAGVNTSGDYYSNITLFFFGHLGIIIFGALLIIEISKTIRKKSDS